ncbi:MAG: hypothetical protein NVSMB70_15100 [Chamaesiphon sp.]
MPKSTPTPSSVPVDPKLVKLNHLRHLSYLWDNSLRIPGTNFRVGIEAIIGLLPIGGDIMGLIFSTYILLQAVQMSLPKLTLLRMVFNILLDSFNCSDYYLCYHDQTTFKSYEHLKSVNLVMSL